MTRRRFIPPLLLVMLASPLLGGCGESTKRTADRREVELSQAQADAISARRDAATLRRELDAARAQLESATGRLATARPTPPTPAPPPVSVPIPAEPPPVPAGPSPPVDVVGEYERKIDELRGQVRTLGRTLDLKDDQISLLLKKLREAGVK